MTDRYKREQELENELQQIFGRISDGFYALDENWQFTHVNERAEEILGIERNDLLGNNVWTMFPEIQNTRFETQYEEAMETQETVSFEEYYSPNDAWFEAHAYPSETGLSVYFRDVTDRIIREQELEQTERRFEAIFNDPNIFVGLLEPGGTVLDINRTAIEYIDADLKEVTGELFWETPWWSEGDAVQSDIKRWTERAVAGEYVDFEADLTPPDSEEYTLSGYFRPVTNNNGDVMSIIISGRDITARKKHEQQLRKSEQRHRTLAENFPNGIVTLYDDDLQYTLAAGEAFDDLPVSPTDIEGESVQDIWPDNLSEVLTSAFQCALEGERQAIEVEYVDREWIVRVVPLTDNYGKVFGGMTIAQDITERKERERAIEESKRRYQTLVEHFPNGAVALYDEDLSYTIAGGELLDELEISSEEIVGSTIYERYPEKLADRFKRRFRDAFEGKSHMFEFEYHGRHLLAHKLPIQNADDEIYSGMLIVQNITEQKEREQELKQRAQQQQVVAELGQFALETDDLDELIHKAADRVADALNNKYCKVLDLDAESEELLLRQGVGWRDGIIGQATVSAVEADSQAAYTLANDCPIIVEDLETETRFSGPELLTNHNVRRGISITIGPVDEPWGIIGTHDTHPQVYTEEDVTFVQSIANILAEAIERHQYQEELEELVADLEESNERLEQFAYAASYDLQEPLRMVSSYLQLIERRYSDELDEDGKEFIEFAVDGADRMRSMIDGLLQYSRVETRGNEFESVDLETVLEDVRSDLQMKIDESNAEITAESLPCVQGDKEQLRQVFQNLLSNAIDYSGEESPQVQISAKRRSTNWTVSVADEGIGIDPDDQDRIFEVFEGLHADKDYPGMGIGLAVCERIIERHGGDIWVESEPGEGATFSFTLPAV